ncbi:PHT4 [Symbiodinium sp. CCMP2456]|nr:PHT4 [Symbiodinium sp. CCMP2456]
MLLSPGPGTRPPDGVPRAVGRVAKAADGAASRSSDFQHAGALGMSVGIAACSAARRCRNKTLRFRRVWTAATAVETVVKPPAIEDESREPPDEPNERNLIVLLVAAAYVIWQMDKVNMSVAILPMAEQMGWDSADEGVIQSSIFWGYAATQIIGGFLATRFGGKRVLLFAVTLWSCATMLAPLAATVSTQVFIASRVLVGIGEGLAPAAGLRMVATWVPESERSRAVSTLGGGKTSGSIAGLLLAPVVINSFGWQAMFYSFGFLGLLWAGVWLIKGKDRDGSATVDGDEPIPWLSILSTPQLWGVVVAHFCHDWGGYALLTWTPTYLNQALGYNLEGSSELTVIPSVCAVAVAAGSGILADNLHGNGMDLTSVRKLFQSVGFFIPSLMLGLLATTATAGNVEPGSLMPIVLLTFGIASGACSYAGLYSSHADLSAKYSALVNAISTTFGALAGVCSNAYAGYMLKATGSWSQAIFLPSIALYVVGWAVYTSLYDATPVDWDAKDEE